MQHISKIWDVLFWLELIILSLGQKSEKNLLGVGRCLTTYFLASFGQVFNWTDEKKLLATCWSPWQDISNQLCTHNVGYCCWNSSSRTFKSLKLQFNYFLTSVYKIQCQTVSYEKLWQIDLVCTNIRTNVDSKRATLW